MMKRNSLILCILVAGFFLLAIECSPDSKLTSQSVATHRSSSSPSPSSILEPKSTQVLPPSPTPHPTLQSNDELQLLTALQNNNCKLPCYLGITPGKTTLQDARSLLLGLGGSALGEYHNETNGATSYTYEFDIGNQISEEKIISSSVSLLTNTGIVQVIIASAGTMLPESSENAIATYRTYWQRYSASQILLQVGEPENLSTTRIERPNQLGTELIILYRKQNMALELYGTGKENNLCPQNEATHLYLYMLLSYPGSTLNIYDVDGRVPLIDQEIYPPIENMFGVTAHQFYERVMADPFTCFGGL